ncbi:MAG TPA: pentapeptide repeat-containing protein [Steroidobacteraceae bacterium]|jgi:uncharacterized protein YjbI with pentapeptide repeats
MSTRSAGFERTEYVEARFREQSFAQGVYSGLRFEECRFESCDLSDCTLEDCRLVDTEFLNCNLSLLQVGGSAFRGVKFTDCKLVGINWTRAHWQRIRMSAQLEFERCILNDSSFAGLHLPQIKMVECRIFDADFSGTDASRPTSVTRISPTRRSITPTSKARTFARPATTASTSRATMSAPQSSLFRKRRRYCVGST